HHLALAALAAQLDARLVDQPEAVQAPARELAARRVEWQQPVPGDVGASLDERAALAPPAEPERLEPGDGEDGEPVVELSRVDVPWLQLGALPHRSARVPGRHRRHVVELVPARPAP